MYSHPIELIATILFVIAIAHTFSVPFFARLANKKGTHAGLWHLLSEVEAVFGVWAFVLIVVFALTAGAGEAVSYLDSRNFTEPAFVFVVMVVAASRPIIDLVTMIVHAIARILPMDRSVSTFFVIMAIVPLAGSFITEPAAMTLAALLLRDGYFRKPGQAGFKYLTIGVLFVNISIGGVLTAYAAPPVLMVANAFGWDSMHMLMNFGWRAAIAVLINASILTLVSRSFLKSGAIGSSETKRDRVPFSVIFVHVLVLIGVVLGAHYPAVFLGLFLMFIGYTHAYPEHQDPLMVREGLMVGFFLAGLIVLGGLQQWWLQDLLGGLSPTVLFWGTLVLSAFTDNAAITYLGSLVEGASDAWRYMLVAGAVVGGGTTVIANAPNPAGFAILKSYFPDGAISPAKLVVSAAVPTLIAAGMFLLPV
ncbi:putative Na+/H+ antiporter [Orrella sp. 11846]|uniref:putative Na+/H+ antiporter n=1 Tax=Orrella sp. 11846 TaxID=3409913 RepID=UPI003B5C7D91